MKVVFYSILPSPYQRDLFYALSQHPEVDLKVNYFEAACADSPWPEKSLRNYERVLPGFHLSWGSSRFHVNTHWPNLKEADVIVFNGYMNVTTQLLLRFRSQQIPCLFWGEKMQASFGGLKGTLQKKLAVALGKCWGVVAIGTQAAQDYRQRFPNKPIFNIPYYCDLSDFSSNIPDRPRQPPTILFCGQMIARKGVDLLIKAFHELIQMRLEARLLLVGREAELPNILKNFPESTTKYIEYAGFQAPERLPQFFTQADIFVLPSRYDGWGVVVNQAVGAGLPVVCSDAVGSAYDLIQIGKNGFIFPNGDVESLTNCLSSYINNTENLKKASIVSQEQAHQWAPLVGAQKWVDVIKKVMEQQL